MRQRANRESPCTNPRFLFFFLNWFGGGEREGEQNGESFIIGITKKPGGRKKKMQCFGFKNWLLLFFFFLDNYQYF